MNKSDANNLRNSEPEEQNFNDILNDHISNFGGHDMFSSDKKQHENFVQMMQGFLNDDKNLISINEAIRASTDDNLPGEMQDMSHLISLSLESHMEVFNLPAKKKDIRMNKKF